MKKLFLATIIFLAFIFNSLSQNLTEPKGGGTLDIVLISPGEGYSIMNFEGNITGYGSVYTNLKFHQLILLKRAEL
jgi:hypothetical protein